ncbi:hypothetical protein [Caloramator sp. mosi_1]|uniref:hypothetical protein n=1 Tax=Caloramator sp. mosi_1 TaxID=3023090 RepID=UPI003FCC4FAB
MNNGQEVDIASIPVRGGEFKFELQAKLEQGEYILKIEAEDRAGNKAYKQYSIEVNFNYIESIEIRNISNRYNPIYANNNLVSMQFIITKKRVFLYL